MCGSAQAEEGLPPDVGHCVVRGLDFLAIQQNPDGSFGASQRPAVTGLAVLGFLAAGQTADLGKHGPGIRAAIEYLESANARDGTFNRERDRDPMSVQAIATFALAEAYGVEENEDDRRRIAGALFRSVPMILKAQSVTKPGPFAGGWRATALDAPDSDLPATAWSVLALRACHDVGVAVPPANVARAGEFILNCWDPQHRGFAYQPHGQAIPSCTGASVLCLHLLDDPQNHFASKPQVRQGYEFLVAHPLDDRTPYLYNAFFFTTKAAWHAGGSTWTAVVKSNFDRLLKLQKPDGGWPQTAEGPGRAYATSLALLTLTTPYRLLPIDQR